MLWCAIVRDATAWWQLRYPCSRRLKLHVQEGQVPVWRKQPVPNHAAAGSAIRLRAAERLLPGRAGSADLGFEMVSKFDNWEAKPGLEYYAIAGGYI